MWTGRSWSATSRCWQGWDSGGCSILAWSLLPRSAPMGRRGSARWSRSCSAAPCGCPCSGTPARPPTCCAIHGSWCTASSPAGDGGEGGFGSTARLAPRAIRIFRRATPPRSVPAWAGLQTRAGPSVRRRRSPVTFIRYDDATGDQHVVQSPPAREFIRRGTTAPAWAHLSRSTTSSPPAADPGDHPVRRCRRAPRGVSATGCGRQACMARMQVSAERAVDAPADTVYRLIADMREHHPRFLPGVF